jgi:hypothetical protein
MAGAGYKLFNTGDVLLASEVNTYLMQQTVMVFNNAAARTTALSGVVSEGMLSYLKDTNAVEVYDGANWVASDDPNAIQNTIVDAKGDLITATGADVPARLAVGNSGETLVADSAATTGLRWQGDYAAGKNKIINGDFSVNQRNFTSVTTADAYGFDLWRQTFSGGTCTMTPQTFTPGAAPISGYEGNKYTQIVTASQTAAGDFAIYYIRLEDARILAGQTATLSFFAKSASGTPQIAPEIIQNFGTGGSPSASVTTLIGQSTLSTSYARYTLSFTVPSVTGKTFGTNNNSYLAIRVWLSAGSTYNANTGSIGINNNTFSLWGFQLEAGSVATAFQTATGTIQGELAACQRYYVRFSSTNNSAAYAFGTASQTNTMDFVIDLPVTMRVDPSAIDFSNIAAADGANALLTGGTLTIPSTTNANDKIFVKYTKTGATQFRPYFLFNNAGAGYIGLSAEL